ncbi:hypothetical protein CHUAL_007718 [Chamberlinius hualienensis]
MWGSGKRKSDNGDSAKENEGQGYRKRKETRMIKMGWGLVNDAGLKVIRSNQGGGPCHNFSVSKQCTKADLIAMGKHIFFPNQRSAIGHESEFTFDIQLGRGISMGDDDTLESFYVASKNCYLRLYLACTRVSDLPRMTDCHSQMTLQVTDCHSLMPHQPITDCNNSRHSAFSDIEGEQEAIKDSVSNDAVYLYKEIRVKRVAIFEDLLNEFSSEFWMDCDMNMVYVSVVVELSDGETVVNEEKETTFKKCLTVFWNQFYESCTKGVRCKVPTLRYDFGERRWMAIARILALGWVKLRYFPILLSPPFINACLEQEPSAADLTESFLLYLPPNESKLISDVMKDFNGANKDELPRILSELNVDADNVNEENILEIVQQIAHQIHIQQPYFIIKHWKVELQSVALEITQESLQEIYKNLIPTSERLISVLRFDQMLAGKHESACGFLRRFIRDSDCEMLARLLHFITGSDMLTVDEIFVSFHENSGFFKPPISLDSVFEADIVISTVYNSYDDFQSELSKAVNRI